MSPPSVVPRRIIQTAKSRDLPPREKAAAANLRLLHPDWEILLFDDNDVRAFITQEFPEHLKVFEGFPRTIQRFDFFRYLAVYRLGGFYFDLDVFLYEPLDPLLLKGCIFPFEELTINGYLRQQHRTDWEIGNYGFGASTGDSFLGLAIENCVRAVRDPAWLRPMMAPIPSPFRDDYYVLNSTGPGMLTRTLVEQPDKASQMTVLFPDDVCDARGWHQFGHYGVHLMAASWRSRGSFVHRRLARWWENRTRAKQLISSRKLGPKRQMPARVVSTI